MYSTQPYLYGQATTVEHLYHTIEVYGEGMYSVEPDRAQVTLGVTTENKSLDVSQNEAALIMKNIMNSLLGLGITKENMKTVEYRIDPQYDYQEGKQILRGYKTTHLIQVTIDQVARTGQVIDTAVNHGANTVQNVVFNLAHPESYYNQALTLALKNAQQKAFIISQSLGIALTPIPSAIEEIPQANITVPYMSTFAAPAQATTELQPGKLQITAKVHLKYTY